MTTKIIHKLDRIDRIPFVAELMRLVPGAEPVPARVPTWGIDPSSIAIRGNGLSVFHSVIAFLRKDDPLLLLEDDAKIIPQGWEKFCENTIPDDAGIVVLGGDVEKYEESLGYFRKILPPFFGSHAVWFSPKLLQTNFVLNGFAIMAEVPLTKQPGGICIESVLLMALHGTGLAAYRPEMMAFTTHSSLSDTFNQVSPIRDKALNIQPTQNHATT